MAFLCLYNLAHSSFFDMLLPYHFYYLILFHYLAYGRFQAISLPLLLISFHLLLFLNSNPFFFNSANKSNFVSVFLLLKLFKFLFSLIFLCLSKLISYCQNYCYSFFDFLLIWAFSSFFHFLKSFSAANIFFSNNSFIESPLSLFSISYFFNASSIKSVSFIFIKSLFTSFFIRKSGISSNYPFLYCIRLFLFRRCFGTEASYSRSKILKPLDRFVYRPKEKA